MFFLKQLFEFLKLLHAENSTGQLACGVVLGMYLGFTPVTTLHWYLYWVVLFLFRINIGAACLAWAVFKATSFGLDPLFHSVGMWALTDLPALKPLWVLGTRMDVVPYTRFNNSIVMGSFLTAAACSLPVGLATVFLIRRYRSLVVARFKTTWLWRAWSGSKLYNLYAKYQEFKN